MSRGGNIEGECLDPHIYVCSTLCMSVGLSRWLIMDLKTSYWHGWGLPHLPPGRFTLLPGSAEYVSNMHALRIKSGTGERV